MDMNDLFFPTHVTKMGVNHLYSITPLAKIGITDL